MFGLVNEMNTDQSENDVDIDNSPLTVVAM